MEFEDNYSELYDFTGELLKTGQPVRVRVVGYSMFPILKDRDKVTVMRVQISELNSGDIVVCNPGSRWVAHRLLKIWTRDGKTTLVTKGDTCRFKDPESVDSQYVARVVSFSRRSEEKSLDSNFYKTTGILIARFSVILTPIFMLYLLLAVSFGKIIRRVRSVMKSLNFSGHGSGNLVLVNGMISIFQGMMPFVVIFLIKTLIDRLSGIQLSSCHAEDRRMLLGLVTATGLAFLASSVLTITGGLFRERLAQSVTRYIYSMLHRKHSSLELAYLEDAGQQDKIHRACSEAAFRPLKMVNEGLTLLQSSVSFLFMAGLMISVHWLVFLLLIFALLPGFVVRMRFSATLYRFTKESSRKEREGNYYNRILTGLAFAKELRLFGLADYFTRRFIQIQSDLHSRKNTLATHHAFAEIGAQFFAVGVIFFSFGYITLLAVDGRLSVGTVVLFFLVFQRGFSVLKDLFQSVAGLSEDSIFLNDFFDFMNLKELYPVPDPRNTLKPLQQGIRVEQVSFQYPSSQRYALNSVTLTIPAGKTVALVGANGSGKTTLVKLLCGFYLPDSGKILFDGADISLFNPEGVRRQVTAVFQDFALYNISAAENIGLGDVTVPVNLQKVKQAAQNAGIANVLEQLPLGYQNSLGNLFEKGEELSIGQWQKISLARAFYRDSPILFLDEPSSALDAETESALLQHLKLLASEKTVLIISHRFTTIRWADIIYVMEEGRLVESGNHDQLMKMGGRYFSMFEKSRN